MNRLGHSVQLLEIGDDGGAGFRLALAVRHDEAAPSDDLADGSSIRAEATATVDTALQNPSPMTSIARRFLMDVTVGANRT
jgi:hypothetical protein